MTNTIFDLVESDLPDGEEGYMEFSGRAPDMQDDSFISQMADYGKTILKGAVEGITKLGHVMGPSQRPEQSKKIREEQTEVLDSLLPTKDTFGQRSIRRGLKEAPSMLAMPGAALNILPRSIAAGFAGEGAKELGAPEWVQSAAELTTFIGPDVLKKLISSGSNKEIIDFAKKMGMTDEQITPLIQSDFKQKWLTKLTPKRGATERALKETKKGLDSTYSTIQKSEFAGKEISEVSNGKLINGIREKLSSMPSDVREKIEKDLADLLNNKITGDSLINFWKDINHKTSNNAKQLSLLKEPVKQALQSISPELAKDFEMINKLYTKYYPIAGKLKPNLMSDIIGAGEALGITGASIAAMFGHYPALITIAGEKAGKKIAQQLLINPRFQQLSEKMRVAINQNKFGLANKVFNDFKGEIKKFSPETAEKLEDLSIEDFEKLINQTEED